MLENLITNRTIADVSDASHLASEGYGYMRLTSVDNNYIIGVENEVILTMTSPYNSKGAYNCTDLNRVGEAVELVSDYLGNYGYSVDVDTKTDWDMGDVPSFGEMEVYLNNIKKIKRSFVYSNTALPSAMDELNYVYANAIEKVLIEMLEGVDKIQASVFYSGDIYTGEV